MLITFIPDFIYVFLSIELAHYITLVLHNMIFYHLDSFDVPYIVIVYVIINALLSNITLRILI